jgi:hypothetical protein
MKRLHVHVSVKDLNRSIGFYSALFATEPCVVKSDYAKWMLDDPRANFAISTRGREAGLAWISTAKNLTNAGLTQGIHLTREFGAKRYPK